MSICDTESYFTHALLFTQCMKESECFRLLHLLISPGYGAIFVLYLICMIYLEGKPSNMHVGLYQVINWPSHWVKIWDFTRFCSDT